LMAEVDERVRQALAPVVEDVLSEAAAVDPDELPITLDN
jgi:hypothetical protein